MAAGYQTGGRKISKMRIASGKLRSALMSANSGNGGMARAYRGIKQLLVVTKQRRSGIA